MNKYENSVGVLIPEILLPKEGTDMTKWAVVACDQFTSQPDYWQETESIVATPLPRSGLCCRKCTLKSRTRPSA